MRRHSLATWLAVVAVFTLAPMAWATQPVQVGTTMELQIHPPDFTTGSGTFEPFISSEGVVIPGGTFVDSVFAAGPTVQGTRILSPDGGGTIEVRFIAFVETGVGKWMVVSATGAYAGLHGGGTSQVVSFVPGETPEVVESWVGSIHFDPAQS